MELLHNFFSTAPMAALFLALAIGFLIGKIKFGNFQLGGMSGCLFAGVLIGQVGVPVDPVVKSMMFALFIYATGYVSGPQFVASLNRKMLSQLHLAVFSAILIFSFIVGIAKFLDLDKGTAAGLLAGALTESACIGTASEALHRMGLDPEHVQTLVANIGVTYALSYLFGMSAVIFFASWIAPRLLKVNLKEEAKGLEATLGVDTSTKLQPGQFAPYEILRSRVYKITAVEAAALTVAEIEKRFEVRINRVASQEKSLDISPSLGLQVGFRVALQGMLDKVLSAGAFLGQESDELEMMSFVNEERDVVVTRKDLRGKTVAEAGKMLDFKHRFGVYATRLTRLDQEIQMYPQTEVHAGDVVRLIGSAKDVDRAAEEIGYSLIPSKAVDYVYLGIGLLVGIVMGMISVNVAGVPISLGTGGGCLLSGLFFGWLRAKHHTFGNLPSPTAQYLRDFGLAIFIVSVGLGTGPQALAQIQQYGLMLPLLGICTALVPCFGMVLYGRFVLKMNPVILCGAVTGNLTSTPALNGVIDVAGSSTPVLGYTVSYAVSNVLLTFLGPLIVYVV
ncbi:aspartate-alanine antiporter [Desulfopila sp. IMCC35008]|uniref:aspartate-alanine antiporter n=1 Tax=Desulfopila sp. IMCC35008 TaxID=2653858 RepID=UPI0013D6EBCF|nr:aspartate-alanine antiporter [Desulfopila sp. IMCC35008]